MAKKPTGRTAVISNGKLRTGLFSARLCAESEEKLGCQKLDCLACSVDQISPMASEILLLERSAFEARDLSKKRIFLGSIDLFERNSSVIYVWERDSRLVMR